MAAILLPAIIGLIAAFTIPVPSDAGASWVFVASFVVLAGASLIALGLGHCVRRFWFSSNTGQTK